MARNFEMDLTKGPLFKKLLIFALPIVGINILQLLFSTVDKIVLGKFVEDATIANLAVGAVGATSSIINLIIGFFIGLSLSSNILIARAVGGKNADSAKRYVGTSIALSLIFGFAIMIGGYFGAETFLKWTGCKEELLSLATKYLKIYCLGMPVIMLYNFAASILRAVGDTLRPLIYLIVGGLANVGLNIFFVIVFDMNVEGVAIATVASQLVAGVLALISIIRSKGYGKLEAKSFRIYKKEFLEILKIGLPLGVSKCLFSFSNVVMQSSINSLGEVATTGASVGGEFDLYIGEILHAFSTASLSFVSQNVGAKNLYRVKKTIVYTVLMAVVVAVVLAGVISLLAKPLCMTIINKNDPNVNEILRYACLRIYLVGNTLVFCGIMNALQEPLKAMGKAFTAMLITLIGSCAFRILWIKTIFDLWFPNSIVAIYLVYPISWILTSVVLLIFTILAFKKLKKQFESEKVVNLAEQIKNDNQQGENNV